MTVVGSLNRHAFRQIARLVDVQAQVVGAVVGEQLQRDDGQHRGEEFVGARDGDHVIGVFTELLVAARRRRR